MNGALNWSRPVSGMERAWLAATSVHPPFVIHVVLGGTGEPDLAAWTEAMEVAAAANPGARAVVRGALCRLRWEAAGPCPVREFSAEGWDGNSSTGAAFFQAPLDPYTGPTTELLLLRGPQARLVLRVCHATMDGSGVLAFLGELFRARNGQPLLGHPDRHTDLELAGPGPRTGVPGPDAVPPMGPPQGDTDRMLWTRLRVENPQSPILGRALVALGRHGREHGDGLVRFDIPVDLRRAHPEVRSTGNLTGIGAIELGVQDTPQSIATRVREAVAAGAHLGRVRGAGFLRHLPMSWIERGARSAGAEHNSRTQFSTTAVVTNLGRIDLGELRAADFQTEELFVVPPGTPVTPLFFLLSGTGRGVDLVLSSPERFCDQGRLEALAAEVGAALSAG